MESEETAASPYLPKEVSAEMGEPRRPGPAEMLNPGEPVQPRPSASVILLRRGNGGGEPGLEVLLLRRTTDASFMPGVWVFPGGALDEEADAGDGAAALRACALRELREEAGVELPPDHELVPFARWITPEVIRRRFDTWFFLALSPPGVEPSPDGGEAVEALWTSPRAALEAGERGEMILVFPTVKKLDELSRYTDAGEAIAAHRGRDVSPVLPKPIATEDGVRLSLPGDPDYPS